MIPDRDFFLRLPVESVPSHGPSSLSHLQLEIIAQGSAVADVPCLTFVFLSPGTANPPSPQPNLQSHSWGRGGEGTGHGNSNSGAGGVPRTPQAPLI